MICFDEIDYTTNKYNINNNEYNKYQTEDEQLKFYLKLQELLDPSSNNLVKKLMLMGNSESEAKDIAYCNMIYLIICAFTLKF